MKHRYRPFALLLVAALSFAVLACPGPVQAEAEVAPPQENPFLTMQILDMHEQPFDAAQLEGMPLMLNFWASWCGPCVSEMPALSQLSEEYAGRLQILGIMTDSVQIDAQGELVFNQKELDGARAYYQKAGIAYPSLIANELMLGIMHQLQMTRIPTTLFIDQQGYLRVQPISGARDKAAWQRMIDSFLADVESPETTETPESPGEGG